jgi:hypothetical protein
MEMAGGPELLRGFLAAVYKSKDNAVVGRIPRR